MPAVIRALDQFSGHRGPVEDSASAGKPASGPRIVSVNKYSGGTVVVLAHGLESTSAAASATNPIQICHVSNTDLNDVMVVGTADGSPVRAARQ